LEGIILKNVNDTNSFIYDLAKKMGVCPEIHKDDFIFQFLAEHPSYQPIEKAIEYYFTDGLSSAQKLSSVLKQDCGISGNQKVDLLEFASGYGCVTRHLKNVVQFLNTTACDIHKEAIDFIQQKLQTNAILSTTHPEDLKLNQEYDVVFALSFFSHMPENTSSRWLKKLASFVKKGGFLIFTTHGLVSRKLLFPHIKFNKAGFYFNSGSEQKDISTKEYGTACTAPKYIFSETLKIANLYPTHFHGGYWWGHQDLYVFKMD
jgi:SAM-dependent methyltransferase